ncbi:putative F-box protein [Cardamine amara subsp. amara]|uniref:F-box protein n=1 Tax=Cardamine amara subsp. amara TaxID=228776 RepID=A0ABD0ZS65_CARAN
MNTNRDWSKLCPDVLRKIFETLKTPLDSHRAKTVCSDWYAVWKTCKNRPPCPLRIIHQGEYSPTVEGTENYFGLFETFQTGYCMASSGDWLLMVDRRLKFYILNILTEEKINLPSMESPIRGEQVKFEPGSEWSEEGYLIGPSHKDMVSYDDTFEWKSSTAVLWINDTTRDYVVAWTFKQLYLFLVKKGEGSWCNLNFNENKKQDVVSRLDYKKKLNNGISLSVLDMACDKSKLYLFTFDHHIKIIDFSGKEITENPYRNHPFDFVEKEWEFIWKRKIAVRKSGEVLIILSLKEVLYEERLLFYVFRMNLESFKWERVYSIRNEMLVFGQGVTIGLSLKDLGDGIKSDTIYFVDDDVWEDHRDHDHRVSDCGVFDIATSRIEWLRNSVLR